jgi:hypothetical protein
MENTLNPGAEVWIKGKYIGAVDDSLAWVEISGRVVWFRKDDLHARMELAELKTALQAAATELRETAAKELREIADDTK